MAVFKGMNREATGEGGRRGVALSGLALLATVVVAAGWTPPPSPLRVELPVSAGGFEADRAANVQSDACRDGVGGSFAREDELQLQRDLGGGRLCARVSGPVRFDARSGAILDLPAGSSVLIETRTAQGGTQRMLVTREQAELRHQWWINGASQPVDDAARAWLADALEVVAAEREIGRVQGEVGRLQGEIGRVQGEIGRLQGRIGSIQGEIGALQGRIGTIQGERGSLQGQIGSHQGAIGSLQGSRFNASAARERQIDKEIAEHEAAIRSLEAQLESSAFGKRLSDAEAELGAFEKSSRGRIAELEQKIDAIRREDRIGQLEQQIEGLHADDRIDEIKRRVAPTVERLAARVRRLGS